ncbi:MAG: CbiX/SirB N-terminal domain-containing protein [Betaproteobacteria bacterium]|nr:CbiX/SirB N-terminal domain-containing protein [Betaproteobacteria bacterium]
MASLEAGDHAIILFAHGARDPQWAEPFRRIREQVSMMRPELRVELAFLELMTPDLLQCVHDLVRDGVRQMTLVPLFMAQGGHLKKDLPPMVRELEMAHSGLRIHVTPAIGESAPLLSAIASWVVQQAS